MKKYCISAFAASNVGKRRFNNEDNYYINYKTVDSSNSTNARIDNVDSFIGAVCDGMGGEAAGEVASQIAVTAIGEFEKSLLSDNCSDSIIEKVINSANDSICNEIKKCKKRLGTTFTLIGINNETVTLSNIGDSRIYRFSDDTLEQISHDHTEAQTMVDAGIVTKEQSMSLKEKHRLTQHLGIFPYEMIIEPYTVRIDSKSDDRYLLCSDGLTDMLTESEIEIILRKNLSLEDTVNCLIELALEKGGRDNVTVLICEITEPKEENYLINELDDNTIACKSLVESKIGISNEKRKSKNALFTMICVLIVLASILIGYGIVKKNSNAVEKEKTNNRSTYTSQTSEYSSEAMELYSTN